MGDVKDIEKKGTWIWNFSTYNLFIIFMFVILFSIVLYLTTGIFILEIPLWVFGDWD